MDPNELTTIEHCIAKNKYLPQYHIRQLKGDVESQNTPSLQTHENPQQTSNNVLMAEVLRY